MARAKQTTANTTRPGRPRRDRSLILRVTRKGLVEAVSALARLLDDANRWSAQVAGAVTDQVDAVRTQLTGHVAECLDEADYQLSVAEADVRQAAACRALLLAMGADHRAMQPGAIERAAGRVRLLRRFGELRPTNPDASNYELLKQVVAEAPSIAPGVRCSVRSMQRWLKAWNTIGPDGLAVGVTAVLDHRGRPEGDGKSRRRTVDGPQGRTKQPPSRTSRGSRKRSTVPRLKLV